MWKVRLIKLCYYTFALCVNRIVFLYFIVCLV